MSDFDKLVLLDLWLNSTSTGCILTGVFPTLVTIQSKIKHIKHFVDLSNVFHGSASTYSNQLENSEYASLYKRLESVGSLYFNAGFASD